MQIHFYPAGSAEAVTVTVDCKPGRTLMQAAVDANLHGIEAECGGLLTCATCHVYVRQPFASMLPPAGSDELGMLAFTASSRHVNSRLSCQIDLTDALDGMAVDLPRTQI